MIKYTDFRPKPRPKPIIKLKDIRDVLNTLEAIKSKIWKVKQENKNAN